MRHKCCDGVNGLLWQQSSFSRLRQEIREYFPGKIKIQTETYEERGESGWRGDLQEEMRASEKTLRREMASLEENLKEFVKQ